MKLTVLAAGVVTLSLAGAACSGSADLDNPAPDVDQAPAVTGTTGTTGTEAPAAELEQPAAQALPETASPLALIGGMGLLSLAGAAAIRRARRR